MRSSKTSDITISNDEQKKGQPKQNTAPDFYWCLTPVLFIYQLIGLRKIFSVDGKLESTGAATRWYSVILSALTIYCEVYLVMDRFETYSRHGYEKAVIDVIIITPSLLAPICTILISANFTSRAMPKFMMNVDMMDSELVINKNKAYSKMRNYVILAHLFFALTLVFVITFDWFTLGVNRFNIFWYVHGTILDFTLIEFVIYVNILRMRLDDVNIKLEAICEDSSDISLPTVYNISGSNNNFAWTEPKSKKLSPKFLKKKFEDYYIIQLMTIYDKIADNTYLLHNCYGVPLFLISITSFANLLSVFNGYLLFHKGHDEDSILLWNSFVWCVKCFWLTTVGAFMSSALQNKTSVTTNTLDKLAINPNSDESQKRLVERFSCLVRCRTLKITACNFFTYDASFIASLVGAFISYSIILMQNNATRSH